MDFKQELIQLLSKETGIKVEDFTSLITIPPDPKMGDYAFPCFKLGGNPKEAAEKLKAKLKLPKFIEKAEVAGPYLNFYLNKSQLAETTLSVIFKQKNKYAQSSLGKNKTIVIDFSSPNIAKPFGIGHLRSTVIGNALYKVHQHLGYKVVGVNHLGDWGTQFGKLIVAFKRWGDKKELEKDPIKYLLKLYVQFHAEAEKEPQLEEEAREYFKKLEDKDKECTALWKLFKELSLTEFNRIYSILNVKFDSYNGESFYSPLLDATVETIGKKLPLEESEGCLIVNLEKYNMPPVLLKKNNESSTYHTRDLAAALYRLKTYAPEKVIYVVGGEQRLHFKQLFKVLELMGIDVNKFTHVDFGLFKFPEGKMSTRKGNVIFLEEVLNKSIEQVRGIIAEKNPTLKHKEEVSQQVGVGAIVFGDLSSDRVRDVNFDWDRMLSFDGETGPYLQYTHARSCSILRKAQAEKNLSVTGKFSAELLNTPEEAAVITQLYNFPEVLIKVLQTYKPHHLANYLITLAQSYNEFYAKCQVVSDEQELMRARLLLVDCVRQVLETGLGLLGIEAPREM